MLSLRQKLVLTCLQAGSTEDSNSVASMPAITPAPAAAALAAAAPAPAVVKDDGLPQGWASALDPTYNHVYYFNVSTGQRTWEKPAAMPKAVQAQVGVLS